MTDNKNIERLMEHMENQYVQMKRDNGIEEMLKDSEDSEPDQYI